MFKLYHRKIIIPSLLVEVTMADWQVKPVTITATTANKARKLKPPEELEKIKEHHPSI